MSAYCITKFGVETFSDVLRREVQPFGVKVILVEPAGYKTTMLSEEYWERIWNKQWTDLSDEAKGVYSENYREKGNETSGLYALASLAIVFAAVKSKDDKALCTLFLHVFPLERRGVSDCTQAKRTRVPLCAATQPRASRLQFTLVLFNP